MAPFAGPRSRSGPVRRGVGLIVAAVLVAGSLAACTPRMGQFEITNLTEEPLLLWDRQIAPGASEGISFDDDRACFDQVELVTADLVLQVTLTEPLCDGDRVTVGREDLVPVRHPASVRNVSSVDILVTFEGGFGADELRLAPGERARIVLVGAIDGCSEGRLLVTVAGQGQSAVTVHPGPVCAGKEWVVDDEALTTGPARMTVVNETDLTFRITTWGVPDEPLGRGSTLEPGQSLELDLGIALGGCLDGAEARARAEAPEPTDELRARTAPLCDGDMWTIAWENVEAFHPMLERWVPGASASMLAFNVTEDSLVRVTVDGEDRAVLEPLQSEQIWLGVGHDACADREIAIWAHPDDGSSEPLVAASEVCDGDSLQVGASPGLHRAGEVITDPGS